MVRSLALGLAVSVSTALAGWMMSAHKSMPDFVRRNDVGEVARRYAFLDIGIAFGVFLVVFVAVAVWRGLDASERLARRAAPLAAAGFLPLLFDHRLWDDWVVVFLTIAGSFGFTVFAVARVSLQTAPVFPRLRERRVRATDRVASLVRRMGRRVPRIDAPLLLTITGTIFYAAYFSAITIEHHRNLGTASFDLGLEDNLMWNLAHWKTPLFRSTPFDGPIGTHLRNHATFISFLMVPVYRLAPGPETLLVIQSVLLGAAAIPMHLFARRHLPVWMATLVGCLYLLYPPVHGANLYDFHYLPLGIVFLWTLIYAVDARRWALAVVTAIIAMSVREDVAFCVAVLGVLLLLTDRAPWFGLGLAVVAGGYFLLMKLVVMPHFGIGHGEESFVRQYEGLVPPGGKKTFGAILETIAGNPGFTANTLLDHDKVQYVLLVFVPLLFVPVTRPIGALLVVPGFVFTLLSTGYQPLYRISFQYTSYWTAFLFIGLVLAFERAGPDRRVPLAAGVLASTLACSYLFGAFFQHETLWGGFDRYRVGTTTADLELRIKLANAIAHLPADGKVAASEFVVPHVSTRESAYTLRFGIYDADWLLFQVPPWSEEKDRTVDALASGAFGVVDDEGAFVLAKRGAAPTANPAVLARLR